MEIQQLRQRLAGLVVLRALRQDSALAQFEKVLWATEQSAQEAIEAIGGFTAILFDTTTNWSDYVLQLVLESENCCICKVATGGANQVLQDALQSELALFQAISMVELSTLSAHMGEEGKSLAFLPAWETTALDFATLYQDRMEHVSEKGYGLFAKYHVFTVDEGALVPVRHPDPQKLSELVGYEPEQAKILANTKALLEGRPANNVLLYGDAGTGKSSAVKAVANIFADQGLRLVEVKKNQLFQIPNIVEQLASNPLKFILFIDDLSFTANDDNFAALKAILEGSVSGKSDNLAVYATSNRRHLVKETLSDRTGDDIHESDTRQELMSLATRFGLTITFSQPDKDKYETIVIALAEEYGLEVDEMLLINAKGFALRSGGRSPRVAKQFIQLRKAGVV